MVEEMLVRLMVEEIDEGIVAGSLLGFLESSGKTSHIVFHSRSISAMSFCTLACKEEVDKAIEALIYRRVGRSVGGRKDLNGLHGLTAFSRVGSKVLMPVLGCEGVFSLQLRRLVSGG